MHLNKIHLLRKIKFYSNTNSGKYICTDSAVICRKTVACLQPAKDNSIKSIIIHIFRIQNSVYCCFSFISNEKGNNNDDYIAASAVLGTWQNNKGRKSSVLRQSGTKFPFMASRKLKKSGTQIKGGKHNVILKESRNQQRNQATPTNNQKPITESRNPN